ncbi:response regulator [Methylotuvimicrobium buryatense]|uniref:Response regulator n=1 Tax=Methylotuvimicrobium buryatense TaxID=95641 RepID=A0A4P9UU57_METBY|nr:response regulator [Methylotuvimicrobium buryatense]QCW83196.1 response regulator [Methylotuvimicrobium buryatense]
MKILIVEDDAVLADGLTYTLTQSGYDVSCAQTGAYAQGLLLAQDFDLVILDLGLPDMDGSEVLWKLRQRKNAVPVLILTARDAMSDRINELKRGADDYMVKPFDCRELESRIHALIRRSYCDFNQHIVIGRLTLDTLQHQILVDDQPLNLLQREYDVLETLMLQAGYVVSKDKIAQRLSTSEDELTDNAIEVYIHRLRKRIKPFGNNIRTIRGLGYLLENWSDE